MLPAAGPMFVAAGSLLLIYLYVRSRTASCRRPLAPMVLSAAVGVVTIAGGVAVWVGVDKGHLIDVVGYNGFTLIYVVIIAILTWRQIPHTPTGRVG